MLSTPSDHALVEDCIFKGILKQYFGAHSRMDTYQKRRSFRVDSYSPSSPVAAIGPGTTQVATKKADLSVQRCRNGSKVGEPDVQVTR